MNNLATLRIPARLQAGDKVAVVSPSWGGPGTFPHRYEAGVKQLEAAFGVQVMAMPHALKDAAWVYANPQARADDLMAAFADPGIKAVIASIGGDDSIRLLPHVDLSVIARNPKIFLGYSDSTALHFMCLAAGVRSYYGPSIMAGFAENGGLHDYVRDNIRRTLFSDEVIGDIAVAPGWTQEHLGWDVPANQTIRRQMQANAGRRVLQGEGRVQGRALPMCADLFPMLSGTSIWPSLDVWRGAVLFFETSEDKPPVTEFTYWLRNMGVQGILGVLSGIVLARPCRTVNDIELYGYDAALQKVVRDEFGLPGLPLITQADFGHTDPMFTVPFRILTELDCRTGRIAFLETGTLP